MGSQKKPGSKPAQSTKAVPKNSISNYPVKNLWEKRPARNKKAGEGNVVAAQFNLRDIKRRTHLVNQSALHLKQNLEELNKSPAIDTKSSRNQRKISDDSDKLPQSSQQVRVLHSIDDNIFAASCQPSLFLSTQRL